MAGDDITGATTFRLVRELDAGPVYGVVTEPMRADDTAGDAAGPARRRPARACWWPPWTGSSPARWRPGRSPPTGSAWPRRSPPERRPGQLGPPGPGGRPPDPRLHPAARRVDRAAPATRLKLGPLASLDAGGRSAAGPGELRDRAVPGTGRDRLRPGRAGRGAAARQAADGGRGTGPAALRLAEPAPAGVTPAAAPGARAERRPARHAAPRSAASDPARLAAYDVLSGVADRDAYANLLLPSVLRAAESGGPGRRAGHRAGLRHAARPGHLRRDPGRLQRPRPRPDRPAGPPRCSGSARTSCWPPGSARTPRSTPRWTWPARSRARAPPGSSTRCCARSPPGTWRPGWTSPRRRGRRPDRPPGRPAQPPALDRAPRCATRSATTRTATWPRPSGPWPRTTSGPG